MLNSNVRTYLQLRGSVNKGIMDTLRTTPAKFLAYNNGISATASKVELDDNGDIIGIYDFQIVNGGQTSASIYKAKASFDISLDDVYVMVKITVVNKPDMYNMMVKNISRYANTQNKIKVSDLSSNDSYNVELANLSRNISATAVPQGVKNNRHLRAPFLPPMPCYASANAITRYPMDHILYICLAFFLPTHQPPHVYNASALRMSFNHFFAGNPVVSLISAARALSVS